MWPDMLIEYVGDLHVYASRLFQSLFNRARFQVDQIERPSSSSLSINNTIRQVLWNPTTSTELILER